MAQDTLARVLAMANSGGGSSDYNDLENKPVAGDGIDISSTTVPVISAKVDGETIVINENGELSGAASVEIDEKTIIENPLTSELETQIGGWKEVNTVTPFPDGAPTIPVINSNGIGGDYDGYSTVAVGEDFYDAIETGVDYAVNLEFTFYTYEELEQQGWGYMYDMVPVQTQNAKLHFNNKDDNSLGQWENALSFEFKRGELDDDWAGPKSCEFYMLKDDGNDRSKFHIYLGFDQLSYVIKSFTITLDNTPYQVTTYHTIDSNYINQDEVVPVVNEKPYSTEDWDSSHYGTVYLKDVGDGKKALDVKIEGVAPIDIQSTTNGSGDKIYLSDFVHLRWNENTLKTSYDSGWHQQLDTVFDAKTSLDMFAGNYITEGLDTTDQDHLNKPKFTVVLDKGPTLMLNQFKQMCIDYYQDTGNTDWITQGTQFNFRYHYVYRADNAQMTNAEVVEYSDSYFDCGFWYDPVNSVWVLDNRTNEKLTENNGVYTFTSWSDTQDPAYDTGYYYSRQLEARLWSTWEQGAYGINQCKYKMPCSPEFIPIDNDTLVIDNGVIKANAACKVHTYTVSGIEALTTLEKQALFTEIKAYIAAGDVVVLSNGVQNFIGSKASLTELDFYSLQTPYVKRNTMQYGTNSDYVYYSLLANGTFSSNASNYNALMCDMSNGEVKAPTNTGGTSIGSSSIPFKNAYFSGDVTANNIPAPPSADGTYTLSCTVSNGSVTYSWS